MDGGAGSGRVKGVTRTGGLRKSSASRALGGAPGNAGGILIANFRLDGLFQSPTTRASAEFPRCPDFGGDRLDGNHGIHQAAFSGCRTDPTAAVFTAGFSRLAIAAGAVGAIGKTGLVGTSSGWRSPRA